MQYLSQNQGKLVVHIGVIPGLDHELFWQTRLKKIRGHQVGEVYAMHLAQAQSAPLEDDRITFWPEKEKLWDFAVAERIIQYKPRLLVVPTISVSNLHEAEFSQMLDNIKLILNAGITVETSLSVVSIARVDDLLNPQVLWPRECLITGDFLRSNVGDYVLHDTNPNDILRQFYRGDILLPDFLKGREFDLLNIGNLTRLREIMFRFVNNHMIDEAKQTVPIQPNLATKQPFSTIRVVKETLIWLAIKTVVFTIIYLLNRQGFLPLPAAAILMVALPVIASIFANPFTAVVIGLLSFVSFNSFFMQQGGFWDSMLDPAASVTLLTFAGVLGCISYLVSKLNVRDRRLLDNDRLLNTLLRLTYDMSYAETPEGASTVAVTTISRTLMHPVAILDNDFNVLAASKSGQTFTDIDLAGARQALSELRIVPCSTTSTWTWIPLHLRQTLLGVVGLDMNEPFDNLPSWENVNLFRAFGDIISTSLRRLQLREASDEAAQEAERESLRSALLSAVSHDLKTPLVSIIGSLSTLRAIDEGLPKAERMELLTTASEEAERLHKMIHNVLEITRIESGSVKPKLNDIDLHEVLDGVLNRMQRYYPGLKIAMLTSPPLPWVESDLLLLEESLFNIMDNAAKYGGIAKPIEVSVTATETDTVVIRFADHGPGIPDEYKEKVFERHQRIAKRDSVVAGSGLGLAICRAMIEVCGGKVWVEDRPDKAKGAVLVAELPLGHKPPINTNEE